VTQTTSPCDRNHSNTASKAAILNQVRAPRPIILQEPDLETRLVVVSRIRVIVAVGAVLFWAATPVLNCLLPCLTTTQAKQECAHHMAMHCGQSTITVGHDCCLISNRLQMASVESYANHLQKRAVALAAAVSSVSSADNLTQSVSLTFLESPPNEHSPHSAVLRI